MNESIKIWLTDLYENEIEEVRGTIENERLWTHGGATVEEAEMHESNIEELEAYIEYLEELIEEIN